MKFAKIILGTGLLIALGVGTFIFTYNKYSEIEDKKAKLTDSVDIAKILEKNKHNVNPKQVTEVEGTEDVEPEEESVVIYDDTSADADDSKVDNSNAENENNELELNQSKSLNNKNDNFIFIGDSRTVAYKKVVDINKYDFVTFIAKVSQGYDWFANTAMSELKARLDNTDLHYNIVLNLGVNDLHNVNKYTQIYNDLAKNNSEHNFFVVSVNPEDEEKMKQHGYKYIGNEPIINFNKIMKESLSENIHFIDSYEYLLNEGFQTTDGLHYDDLTSSKILDFVSNYIKSI